MAFLRRMFGRRAPAKAPALDVITTLSATLVDVATAHAGEFVRASRARGLGLTRGEPQRVLREFVFFYLHLADRTGSAVLNEPTAHVTLQTLIPTSLAMYLRSQQPDSSIDECSDAAHNLLAPFDVVNLRVRRAFARRVRRDHRRSAPIGGLALRRARSSCGRGSERCGVTQLGHPNAATSNARTGSGGVIQPPCSDPQRLSSRRPPNTSARG